MAAIDLPYCDISVQESFSKLNKRPMSSGFFFFFFYHHAAASQSQKHCVHAGLSPLCLEILRHRWCLLQVIFRALALTGTLAIRGTPLNPRGQCVIVLMWFFGIWCSSKTPTAYLLTAMCRLENYKYTDCQSSLNLNSAMQTVIICFPEKDLDILSFCFWVCPLLMKSGCLSISVCTKLFLIAFLQGNIRKACKVGYVQKAAVNMTFHIWYPA